MRSPGEASLFEPCLKVFRLMWDPPISALPDETSVVL